MSTSASPRPQQPPDNTMPDSSRIPEPAVLLQLVAFGGVAVVAAGAATTLALPLRSVVPGSLVFSAALVAAAVWLPRLLPAAVQGRATSAAAIASLGAVPFVAYCCDLALVPPTWDARPLEGIGLIFMAAFAIALLVVGTVLAYLVSLLMLYLPDGVTRACARASAVAGILAALVLSVQAGARRACYPDPDSYFPSLPRAPLVDGDRCSQEVCVRCPPGRGPRQVAVVGSAGVRPLGDVDAPCSELDFRRDPARGWILLRGDVDHGGTLRRWPRVRVFKETGWGLPEVHLNELRDGLGPPLGWVVEGLLGVLGAVGVFAMGLTRARAAHPPAGNAMGTAYAAVALLMSLLFATPLAVAWVAGLVR